MTLHTLDLSLDTEADTQALAECLAAQAGIANCTLSLRGDLGAGKTTFTRHLLRALGATGRIKSPTYALVEPYEDLPSRHGLLQVWHFDFYRLQDPDEVEEAGLPELFDSSGLKIVEWLSQAGDQAPRLDVELALRISGETRREATLTAFSAVGQQLLEGCGP